MALLVGDTRGAQQEESVVVPDTAVRMRISLRLTRRSLEGRHCYCSQPIRHDA